MLKRTSNKITHFILLVLLAYLPISVYGNETDSLFYQLHSFELTDKVSINLYKKTLTSASSSLSQDTLLPLYEKGLTAAEELKEDTLIHHFASRTAYIYYITGDYPKAKAYLQLELNHGRAMESKHNIARANFYLGNIEMAQENFIQAIDYFLLSAEIGVETKEKNMYKYFSYINLNNCCNLLGETKQSIENLKLAEPYFRQLPDTINVNLYYLSVVYSGLAQSYESLEQLDSADYYIEQMLLLSETIERSKTKLTHQDKINVGNNYIDAFMHYFRTDSLEKAEELYKKISPLNFYPEKKYYVDFQKKNKT